MKKIIFMIACLVSFTTVIGQNSFQSDVIRTDRSQVTLQDLIRQRDIGFTPQMKENLTRHEVRLLQSAESGNRSTAVVTITQSNSQTIEIGEGIACAQHPIAFRDNNFYRDFDLPGQFGITNGFEVEAVEFALEDVSTLDGFPITINIYSATPGTFPNGSKTLEGTAVHMASNSDAMSIVNLPLSATIPAGKSMIMELEIIDDGTETNYMVTGVNSAGETGPSYIMAPVCGANSPTPFANLGLNVGLVWNVIGDDAPSGGGPFPDPYCEVSGNTTVEAISRVVFADIDNSSDPNGTERHEDFTSVVGHVNPGETYSFAGEGNTAGNFTNYFTVWVDWNQDGVFDESTERYDIGSINNSTGSDGKQAVNDIDVPADALEGATRMRVMKRFNDYPTSSCASGSSFGQTEDYTVEVSGGGGPFPSPYCEVSGNTTVEAISRVIFADIDNSSDPNGTVAHEDFTSVVGHVNAGETYSFAGEGNTAGNFTNYFTVWVDWNQDGVFDESTERYDIGSINNSTGSDGKQAVNDIDVPADALEGATRMRVMKRFSNYPTDSCTSGSTWGQTEDYTVEVSGGGGGECDWTVIVQDIGFGDEIEWELRDQVSGTVLLSGGDYGLVYYDEQSVTAEGPLEFYITNDGFYGDNQAEYSVSNGTEILVSGIMPLGGATYVFSDLNCDDGGGGGGGECDITTLYAGGNNGSAGGAVYFDVTVGNVDIDLTALDVNTDNAGGAITLDVYTLEGTYAGNETNQGAWTLRTQASGTGAGQGNPSHVELDDSFTLSANTTYGLALVFTSNNSHYYTNGNGANQHYEDDYIALDLGSASNTPFDSPFSPRVFNGGLYYEVEGGCGGVEPVGECDITTLYAGGNNGSAGGAVYFDVTVGGVEIDLTALDVNTDNTGGAITLDVYTLEGTYAGNETNQGAWTLRTQASGTSAGQGNPSHVELDDSFTLSANTTYGLALVFTSSNSHYYTNGNGANQHYEDDHIALDLGSASNTPFDSPFSPRVFNGGLYYEVEGGCGGGVDPDPVSCPIEYSGDFEDGLGNMAAGIILAADFPVPAGETWDVGVAKFELLYDVNTVSISFYEDGGAQPGAQIAGPTSLTPASQTVIGQTTNGTDIYEVELDLSGLGVSLDGGSSGANYWVAIETTNSSGTSFWHYADTANNGTYFFYSTDYASWTDASTAGFPVDGAFSICIGEGGGSGDDCGQGDDSNEFENGFNITAGGSFRNADDFFVSPDNTLNIKSIEMNLFLDAPASSINLNFYEDNGGTPGNTIVESVSGLVPYAQVPVGANFGYIIYSVFVEVDLNFAGGSSGTSYWMQPEAVAGTAFWEITSVGTLGEPIHTSESGGAWMPDEDGSHGVFKLHCDVATPPDPQCLFDISFSVEPITRVVLSDIDNPSSATVNGSPALEDFTHIVGGMVQNTSYEVALEGNTDGPFTNYFTVWIDWDQNGQWDSSEMYEIGSITNSTGVDGQQATGTISVPADAVLGETAMRVIKNYNVSPTNPCGIYDFGQAEDYTINVTEFIGVEDQNQVAFTYYPNPTTGMVTIEANRDISSVSVMNVLGQEVMASGKLESGQVDLSSLATGTYLFRVTFEDGTTETFKIIRE